MNEEQLNEMAFWLVGFIIGLIGIGFFTYILR
jgi:hypothetical protein